MPRAWTIGVRSVHPVFFWDFDNTPLGTLESFLKALFSKRDYDIYCSSHNRYHLVMEVKNWDECQELCQKFLKYFPNEQYIANCRRQRLRVAPKYDIISDLIVCPAPYLLVCNCMNHFERRIGVREKYETEVHS